MRLCRTVFVLLGLIVCAVDARADEANTSEANISDSDNSNSANNPTEPRFTLQYGRGV
jgi:hypothetical protein